MGTIFCTSSVYANVIWPALFISAKILYSWPQLLCLILVSLLVEGFMLHIFIEDITYPRAFFVALVGNIASTIVGTFITTFGVLFSVELFLDIHQLALRILATWIALYAGSVFIEIWTIKVLFGYRIKQLLVPVLIGNLVTYFMVIGYHFPKEFLGLFTR